MSASNIKQLRDLPESNAGYTGGTNGSVAETSASDLRRGFSLIDSGPPPYDDLLMPFDEQVGGFLDRPKGWQR